tara:strand:- start:1294 stop:2199 length:906 start_codon:yes stop_codon:yes gene_type:complete
MTQITTRKDLNEELKSFITDKSLINNCRPRSIIKILILSLTTYSFIPLSIFLYHINSNLIIVSFLLLLVSQRHFQTHVHDSAHLFISGNRKVNDLVSNFLYAGFIGMTVESYRQIHQNHHKYNGSEDDPEYFSFEDVKKYGGLTGLCLSYALGLEAFKLIKKYYVKQEGKDKEDKNFIHIIFCQLILFLFFISFDAYFFYFAWLYLALSLSPLLSRLRFLVEHPGKNNTTKTSTSTLFEKIFFAPHNFNYHYEHHMFPLVPPYNLSRIHNHIRANNFFEENPKNLNTFFLKALYTKIKKKS